MADKNHDPQNPPELEEALRLKTLAEEKYVAGNLKSALKLAKKACHRNPSLDGISDMLTAFRIIRTANKNVGLTPSDGTLLSASTSTPSPLDYYKILQVERFAHINTIKKQYKKLALTLHPDKNSFVASEEAFKYVGEAFRVLSDRIRRKEYDMSVRIAMQKEAEAATGVGLGIGEPETFWTACSTCRLLHKFESKYLGHNLVCPSCKKSFKAVEVDEGNNKDKNVEQNEKVEQNERLVRRISERIRARKGGKMSSVGEILRRSIGNEKAMRNINEDNGVKSVDKDLDDGSVNETLGNSCGDGVIEDLGSSRRKEERSGVDEVVTRARQKRAKVAEEDMMTLAQMQMLVKKKVCEEKMRLKGKEKGKENKEEKKNDMSNVEEMEDMSEDEEIENDESKQKEMEMDKEKENGKKGANIFVRHRENRQRRGVLKVDFVETFEKRTSKTYGDSGSDKSKKSRQDKMDTVAVEKLSFYDFDKDRLERRFKKGQVWATYDSEDGMPRHYALIEEVVSLNPFEVRLSLLVSNEDKQLSNLEKMGLHISCGRFKVSEKTSIKSWKMFSHIADFERVARQVYWIYPKKGSVWALYNENALNSEQRVLKDRYCDDIVVLLKSYCKIHGMSIAHLEKVDGFRTVFKRKEIGPHAIRWLANDNLRLFSHQIPAKKLSGEEATGLPGECWELDPSSLPPRPLTVG